MAVLLTGSLATTLWAEAKVEDKKVEGELVDLHCYSKGGAKGDGHASCAEKCLKSGIPAGVLSEGKVLTIATNPEPLAQYAGRTIRIDGKVNEETHSIIPTKVEVKKDDKWEEVKLKDEHHK
ncbi:MAG: hypothetical protein M3463_22670 [Verrucomicrobiota bacterium]|nr:hypothetical protein [Verrucomicrobiota bacterium]